MWNLQKNVWYEQESMFYLKKMFLTRRDMSLSQRTWIEKTHNENTLIIR